MIEIKKWMLYSLLTLALLLAGLSVTTSVVLMHRDTQLQQADHGDLNHDGKVDALDLSILSSHWTKTR